MARPPSITDDEVLAAARAVFLDRGVTATVEEVAARCGVGEATVFRRFPTKQALFVAAMDTHNELEWARMLEEYAPKPGRKNAHDTREALLALANGLLATGRKMLPLILMKMSNPAMIDRDRPPARVLKTLRILSDFFAEEIQAGRVRPGDPRVAARIWMGSLQHLIMFETFMKPVDSLSPQVYLEGLVDLSMLREVQRVNH